MPNCSAKREPADPTNASVIRSDASLNRQVRRPYHCTVFGRRSVKIWCPQASVSQKNRRTRSSIRTGIPSQGRSLSRRQYRLWIRRDVCPHSGQTLPSTAGEEPSQARFVLPPLSDQPPLHRHPAPMFHVPSQSAGDPQSLPIFYSRTPARQSVGRGSSNVRKNRFCSALDSGNR